MTVVQHLELDPRFESGIEMQDFRNAMASLAASACLVTAGEGAARLGRTVTAAMLLTGTPPTILVSIDATSALAVLIRKRAGFSFAMLAVGQRDIADAFAGNARRSSGLNREAEAVAPPVIRV